MRVLFDQGTPVPLRKLLGGHSVSTAFELGWATLENGELLNRAQKDFDVLVTTDRNLPRQQNLKSFDVAVVVLPTTSWPKLRVHGQKILEAVEQAKPGECAEVVLERPRGRSTPTP